MESPAWMFTKALSHSQKVCRLYKRALRECNAWYDPDPLRVRYQQCVIRARFEANRDVKDPRKAQILLAEGCKEIWEKRHYKPYRFALDPGGSAYDRVHREGTDYAIDTDVFTYPEREQFPYYYNRREQRKTELLEHWHKIEKSWNDELDAIQKDLPKETPAVSTST